MKSIQLVAIVLIVLGALALAYGGFTYTLESHQASLGPPSLAVDDRVQISTSVWAGVGGILVGGLLFVVGRSPR